ncbi:hypothetical protein Bca4012_064728 [Brassica carinata]
MVIFAAFVIVPFGFLVSGLIINLIQLVLFIFARPVSRRLYRRINTRVVELLWLQLIWLVDWWACIKINFYADAETLELLGKEHALVLCNHRGDIDWLIGWVMAQRSGCLGSTLAIMKKEAKYFPIIGWSMWFSEYIFLEKNWAKDENILKAGFNQLKDFPTTFWLGLFVEGTRSTQENLQAARDYASLKGLPSPRNVLIPRTKGFVSAVAHIRSFVPAVYDCTYTVHKKQSAPTFLRMFTGQLSEVNLQMKRYQMSQLPEAADGIAQWCRDLFVAKPNRNNSWMANKLIKLRGEVFTWIKLRIGNGLTCRFWTDNWSPYGSLESHLLTGYSSRQGIPATAYLADLCIEGNWQLPPARTDKHLELHVYLTTITLTDEPDYYEWILDDKVSHKYKTGEVYKKLRGEEDVVPCFYSATSDPVLSIKSTVPNNLYKNSPLQTETSRRLDYFSICLPCLICFFISTCIGSGVILWTISVSLSVKKLFKFAAVEDKTRLGKPVKIMTMPVTTYVEAGG